MKCQIQFQPFLETPIIVFDCERQEIKDFLETISRQNELYNSYVLTKAIRRGLRRFRHDIYAKTATAKGYTFFCSSNDYGAFCLVWLSPDARSSTLIHEAVHVVRAFEQREWLDGEETAAYLVQSIVESWNGDAFGVPGPEELPKCERHE